VSLFFIVDSLPMSAPNPPSLQIKVVDGAITIDLDADVARHFLMQLVASSKQEKPRVAAVVDEASGEEDEKAPPPRKRQRLAAPAQPGPVSRFMLEYRRNPDSIAERWQKEFPSVVPHLVTAFAPAAGVARAAVPHHDKSKEEKEEELGLGISSRSSSSSSPRAAARREAEVKTRVAMSQKGSASSSSSIVG
jgi:hypothetical protein